MIEGMPNQPVLQCETAVSLGNRSGFINGWFPSLIWALGCMTLGTQMRRPLSAAILAVIALGTTGCVGLGSGSLPPRANAAERARLKDAHLPITIGVATNAGGAMVISRLRKTRLFDAVDYVDRLPSPPCVLAQFEHTPYGTATIPISSLLTFGIVPTIVREPLSFGCTFYSPHHPEQRVKVAYLYHCRTTLGWIAPLLALSSNVVMIPWAPDEHRRFYDHLSLAILDHAEEILKLAE